MRTSLVHASIFGNYTEEEKVSSFAAKLTTQRDDYKIPWDEHLYNNDHYQAILNTLPAEAVEIMQNTDLNKYSVSEKRGYGREIMSGEKDPIADFDIILRKYVSVSCQDEKPTVVLFKKYKNNKPHSNMMVYIGTMEKLYLTGKWYIGETISDSFEAVLSTFKD